MKCSQGSAILACLLFTASALANTPPTPTIIEPGTDGQELSPADVHMETAPFFDPDGDTLVCADWRITEVSSTTIVWAATCATDFSAVHIHLGDGAFTNSYAGRTTLLYDTDYILHVRQKDSAGFYSDYAARLFRTGSATLIFPLHTADIESSPAPVWLDSTSADVLLPAGSSPPSLRVESAAGDLLLQFLGANGATNLLINPATLPSHVDVRVKIDAGDTGGALVLPDSTITFADEDGATHTIYLPAVSVPQGESAYYWVSANGSTYHGAAAQDTPDFSNLARGSPVPWQVNQPGYKVEVVATGFQLPVNIAFVPNPGTSSNSPLYYVAELYGNIKVVTRGGSVHTYASGLLNFNPTGAFPGSGEQGLAGLVVEPATGDVLVSLLYSSTPGLESAPHYPKVVRFHSNDGGLTATNQTTVLDMPGEPVGQSHQQSNLSIGPDGKLYLHMGDGFDTAAGQDTNTFRGKILRFNFNGTPANDNPLFNAGNGTNATDYIFTYGHRNPFGGAWRAADGFHYMVENGPSVDRLAKMVAGRNYGWDGSDASMTNFAIYNWNPAVAPVNIAFTQSSTFDGSGFPTNKYDHVYVTESGPAYAAGPQPFGKRITEFVLDSAGNLQSGPMPLIEYTGSGYATAVGLAAGPDGLYFTDLYKDLDATSPIDAGASVLRIKFVGAADFTADITSATDAPFTVQFTDLSSVPSPSGWLWDFGDGVTSTLQNPTHTYNTPGVYDVKLSVTGATGVQIARKIDFIAIGAVGLQGQYFDNIDFTNLKITRTDGTVNFDWGNGSPDPLVDPNMFSVRWTGGVVPRFSESHTFYTMCDDGVRLWVNGVPIVDNWTDHAPIENSGSITLIAGLRYEIAMEYYENGGGAVAKLSWSSPSTAKQIIPQNALSPPPATVQPTVNITHPVDGNVFPPGANVTMIATANDSDGFITNVDFYANSTKIGAATSAPYTSTWSNVVAGAYALTAVAYDNAGGSAISTARNITVTSGTEGLIGQYYDNVDLTNLKVSRVDTNVNFNWAVGSPDSLIGPDTFSVRWTGKVKPSFSQTYTFYTTTDDGVRLYIDGQLIIDKWVDQGSTEWSGTLALAAGQLYDVKMEYYENGGGALATLAWSSPSQPKQLIPPGALFIGTPGNQAPAVSVGTNQTITLPSSIMIAGIITDDGLPAPPEVTTSAWSMVSGPGIVTFDNTNAVNTSASFSTNGTYVLRLTANDSVLSASADMTVTVMSAFEQWQMQYFGCTNCAQAAAEADPDGDGSNNLQESLAGTDPTNGSSALRITSLVLEGDDIRVNWTAVSNKTYSVQVTTNFADGFTNAFADLATVIVPLNTPITETNYLDLGGATNPPALYYRIRLAP